MKPQTSAAARPRLRPPREDYALRPTASQIDFRCDRRSRSHRLPASSSHGFQSHAANIRPIMPRGPPRINSLLRAAAMLFPREDLLSIDGFTDRQSGRLKGLSRWIIPTTPPRQFSLDSACHGIAERAAEVERPKSIRHHLGGNAMKVKSFAERCLQIIREHRAGGPGVAEN